METRKRILAVVALFILLGSCDLFRALDPLIGTWNGTVLWLSLSYDFKADGTFSMSTSNGSTVSGLWSKSTQKITLDFEDGNQIVWNFIMSADGTSMVISAPDGSIAVALTKQ